MKKTRPVILKAGLEPRHLPHQDFPGKTGASCKQRERASTLSPTHHVWSFRSLTSPIHQHRNRSIATVAHPDHAQDSSLRQQLAEEVPPSRRSAALIPFDSGLPSGTEKAVERLGREMAPQLSSNFSNAHQHGLECLQYRLRAHVSHTSHRNKFTAFLSRQTSTTHACLSMAAPSSWPFKSLYCRHYLAISFSLHLCVIAASIKTTAATATTTNTNTSNTSRAIVLNISLVFASDSVADLSGLSPAQLPASRRRRRRSPNP